MSQREKAYKELTFTDDFMFCKVLENNEELCKDLLELILKRKIHKLVYLSNQQTIDITSDGKGVRLDVYLEDDEDTVFDIEMQTIAYGNLPKRARYYQGMIDLNLIEKGADYAELLNYLAGKGGNSILVKKIDEAVHKAKNKKEWRKQYMTLYMIERQRFAEGKAEGKAEGIHIANVGKIQVMIRKGYSKTEILDLEFTEEEYAEAEKELHTTV